MQSCHCTIQFRIHVPGICCVNDILQFSLTLHQFIHLVSILVIFRQAKLHVDVVIFLQSIINALHTFHHILLYGLLFIQRGILRKITNGIAWTPNHLTLELLIQSSYNLHQRRFTCTIQTNNTNLRSIEETQVYILEHLFLVLLDGLAHTHHRENHFLVVNCSHNRK